jgi:hypothetical protein
MKITEITVTKGRTFKRKKDDRTITTQVSIKVAPNVRDKFTVTQIVETLQHDIEEILSREEGRHT